MGKAVRLLLVCSLWIVSSGCSSTEGSLTYSGKAFGKFALKPSSCHSGEHSGYFGVLLDDEEAGGQVKVIKDQRGDMVKIIVPGTCDAEGNCQSLRFEKEDCSVFDLDVAYTNLTVNDVRALDGRIDLACEYDGGKTEAHFVFSRCS